MVCYVDTIYKENKTYSLRIQMVISKHITSVVLAHLHDKPGHQDYNERPGYQQDVESYVQAC